jgi:hypothetical protein
MGLGVDDSLVMLPVVAVGLVAAWFLWRASTTAPRPVSKQAKRTTPPKDLLPERDGSTPEGEARAVLWAMDNLLPWHAEHQSEGRHVLRTPEELAALWKEQGGKDEAMPAVDFEHHMVLALFEAEGEYTTAHNISRVLAHEGKVWVIVGKFSRPWAMMNPASVIAVPRADGEVVFLDESDDKAQALLRFLPE